MNEPIIHDLTPFRGHPHSVIEFDPVDDSNPNETALELHVFALPGGTTALWLDALGRVLKIETHIGLA